MNPSFYYKFSWDMFSYKKSFGQTNYLVNLVNVCLLSNTGKCQRPLSAQLVPDTQEEYWLSYMSASCMAKPIYMEAGSTPFCFLRELLSHPSKVLPARGTT